MDTRATLRQQLIRRAEGYLELGMPEHALEVLERVGSSPFLAHAAYLKGEALRELNRYQEAADQLELAAELTPDDIHIWLALGWCYKRTARLPLAIEALEKALEIEPGDALLHYNLACYWSLARNKRRAISYLAEALSIDANYRDLIDSERDFDPIRDDPRFIELTSVIV